MKPLGVAVVGAGYWGPNLARGFSNSADCELRWVCDLDPARAGATARRSKSARATTALGQVLDDLEVEAVAVATPAASHAGLVRACLGAGRHVLVEKPLALSLADADRLAVTAAQCGRVLMCDHTYCYTPAVRMIRDLIQSGDLGELHSVDSVRVNRGRVQPDVDVFWDLAHHDLSILDFVLPDGRVPTAISARGSDPLGVGRACVGWLTLDLIGSARVQVHVSWLSPTKVRTTILSGSRRVLVWDDLHPTARLRVSPRGADAIGSQAGGGPSAVPEIGAVALPLARTEALSGVVAEFVAAIREQRPPLTGVASELRVLAMLEVASQSLARDGAVMLLGIGRRSQGCRMPAGYRAPDASSRGVTLSGPSRTTGAPDWV